MREKGSLDAQLTRGVLDMSARRVLTHGGCGALAIALHDLTGWPIIAITDHHNVNDGMAEGGSALHWVVKHPRGLLLDIDGYHTAAELLAEYHDEADDGRAAIGTSSRADAVEWWEEAGELVSLDMASSIARALLDSIREE